MWWHSPRLDRIEQNMEQMQHSIQKMQHSIQDLSEISKSTNRRIDRFVEIMSEQILEQREETAQLREQTFQLKRAVDYLLSKDG